MSARESWATGGSILHFLDWKKTAHSIKIMKKCVRSMHSAISAVFGAHLCLHVFLDGRDGAQFKGPGRRAAGHEGRTQCVQREGRPAKCGAQPHFRES